MLEGGVKFLKGTGYIGKLHKDNCKMLHMGEKTDEQICCKTELACNTNLIEKHLRKGL